MLIFVENVNDRLSYTFDFIFKERDLNYTFTTSESEFEKSLEIKLNYSKKNIANTPSIIPSTMLFNNRIYGLTKGQYSPTSEVGKITKSTPMGSLDEPFNPLTLALGAGATFIARTIDKESKHLQEMITESYQHKGTSFMEIYQNCNIFNDGAFSDFTDRDLKQDTVLWLKDGEPMIFGAEKNKGIRLEGNVPTVVEIGKKWSIDDLLVHDKKDYMIASMLSNMTSKPDTPEPIGVLYAVDKPTYEDNIESQLEDARNKKPKGSIQDILNAGDTWVVK